MVEMIPIKNLKAETQKAGFDKVMAILYRVGLNVIGISINNAPANRKFFRVSSWWCIEGIRSQLFYWTNIFDF